MPIINDVKENYHNVDMKATYVHVFGKSDQLQATLWGGYSNSNSDYKGTSPNKQQLSEGFLQFLPTYTHRFGRNLALSLCPGLFWETYKVNELQRVTNLWFRPSLNGYYKIWKNSTLSLYALWGQVCPIVRYYKELEWNIVLCTQSL